MLQVPKIFYIINVSSEYDKDLFFLYISITISFIYIIFNNFSRKDNKYGKIINNHPFTNIMQKRLRNIFKLFK